MSDEQKKNQTINSEEGSCPAAPTLRLVKDETTQTPRRFTPKSNSKFVESLNDYTDRLELEIQHILSL
jgi:hypothetical protein